MRALPVKRWLIAVCLCVMPTPAPAQIQVNGGRVIISQGGNDAVVSAAGALSMNLAQVGGTNVSGANVVDAGNTAFRVNCVTGCTAGGSFTDNTAFTAGTTSVTNFGAVFNDSITALTSGNAGALRATTDRMLFVNLGKVGGTAIALGQTTMTSSLPVAIASNQSAFPVTLNAGANIIGKTVPATACGTTVASQALAAVPTTSTAVFSSTTCVAAIVLNNTTSGALTVSVSDNQGTPVSDVLTFSIPAFSQLIQPLHGVQFTSGVKWNASASGVTGAILGYQ